jgi:hypothetical protein
LIPVVVHVVYKTGQENISDAVIRSQLDILNQDFRRQNTDRNNTPSVFPANDAKIQFYLACTDPNGNPTNGITRTQTTKNSFSMPSAVTTSSTCLSGIRFTGIDEVKSDNHGGKSSWNSNQYLNIWVCNFADGLGFATLPFMQSDRPQYDGIVIDYRCFGNTGTTYGTIDGVNYNSYNLGRTATHEIGHWLNLYHIWGDDDFCADKCSGTDYVSDTPNQRNSTFGCPTTITSCENGINAMTMNYMDYTDDACMNAFTTGQKNRMRANFSSGQPKANFQNQEVYIQGTTQLGDVTQNGNVVFNDKSYIISVGRSSGFTTIWEVSAGITIISQGNSGITLRGNTGYSSGWIRATVQNAGVCGSINVSSIQHDIIVDPLANNNACNCGFTLQSAIQNVGQASGQFTFNSCSVSGMNWQLLSGSTVVDNGTITSVTSSTMPFNISSSVNSGSYTLRVEATNCTGSGTVSFNYTKPGGGGNLSLSQSSWSPSSSANTLNINVTANIGWSVATSDGSWLTVSPTSGSNNGSFTISTTANSLTASRSGTITVSGGGVGSQTVNVTQAGTSGGTDPDRTEGGTAGDDGANNPAPEGEEKAFDNQSGTKWLVYSSTGNISYDFSGDDAYAVNRYTVTSANDAPDRDPKNWNFQGSNDGVNWTTIDSRNDQFIGAPRFDLRTFTISNTTAYKRYRLNVTANHGNGLL